MNLSEAQIFNLEGGSETSLLASHKIDYSSLLLDWIVDNSFLSSEVFESNLELSGQKFFRFSISSMDNDGNQYHGFGRSCPAFLLIGLLTRVFKG